MHEVIIYSFIVTIIIISIYTDKKYYKVLNKVVFPAMLIGASTLFALEGISGFTSSVKSIFLTMMVLFIFYIPKFLGAGDIKLIAVIASFIGFGQAIFVMLYSFLAGGVIALFLLLIRKNGIARFKKLLGYMKLTFYLGKLTKYDEGKNDEKGIFRFTYAIFVGYSLYLLEVFGVLVLFQVY